MYKILNPGSELLPRPIAVSMHLCLQVCLSVANRSSACP